MSILDPSPTSATLPSLAVTGSTGLLGGLVAREVAAAGTAQRLPVRRLARAPELPGAVAVEFTGYDDATSSVAALRGVTTLFMVSAAENADRLGQHRAFVDAAREAGVEHVVYTSFLGAAADCTFTLGRDHHATEEHLRASGMAFTFLRDSFYLDFFSDVVGDDGVIRGPAGEGRVGAVARADVARVAAAVLADPGAHAGATYDLTGPETLSFAEVATQLSAALGKPVSFHDETLEEAYVSRAPWGAPDWQNDAWVSTYTAIAAGELDVLTTAVEDLTGRAPTSLAQLLASRS